MIRERLNDSLKAAVKSKHSRAVSTLRLILAALKDRDIAARTKGNADGVDDEEILRLLQTMIKQCQDSIALYKKGGRRDLVERETAEIAVIESFLPEQLSDKEVAASVAEAIEELGATGLKDMGRVMSLLRGRHAGRMDFARANGIVKEQLG